MHDDDQGSRYLNPNRNLPYHDGRVYVMKEQCHTCVFRRGNPMHLQPGRLKILVASNLDAGSALVCHKTIYDAGYVQQAICRGFADAYTDEILPLMVAKAMGVLVETDGRGDTDPDPDPDDDINNINDQQGEA